MQQALQLDALSREDQDTVESLWNELVAKLRHELNALELQGKLHNTKVDEPLRNEVVATSDEGFISIWLNTETGQGSWNQIAPVDQCEPSSMTARGTAFLSGKIMTLSECAVVFASKFLAER